MVPFSSICGRYFFPRSCSCSNSLPLPRAYGLSFLPLSIPPLFSAVCPFSFFCSGSAASIFFHYSFANFFPFPTLFSTTQVVRFFFLLYFPFRPKLGTPSRAKRRVFFPFPLLGLSAGGNSPFPFGCLTNDTQEGVTSSAPAGNRFPPHYMLPFGGVPSGSFLFPRVCDHALFFPPNLFSLPTLWNQILSPSFLDKVFRGSGAFFFLQSIPLPSFFLTCGPMSTPELITDVFFLLFPLGFRYDPFPLSFLNGAAELRAMTFS